MMGLPVELLSIAGLVIVGHIGGTVIVEMGGKLISVWWNMICYAASAVIGLNYVWDMMHKVYSVVTHF